MDNVWVSMGCRTYFVRPTVPLFDAMRCASVQVEKILISACYRCRADWNGEELGALLGLKMDDPLPDSVLDQLAPVVQVELTHKL